MAINYIVIIFLVAITYCVCHPIKSDNSRDVNGSSVTVEDVTSAVTKRTQNLMDILNSAITNSENHVIVKRSRRGGIFNGGNCPEGEGNLPTGECVPCTGRNLPGCPEVDNGDDYSNEV